jgi:TonB family protein
MKRPWKVIGLFVVVFLLAVSIHVLRASGQAGTVSTPSAGSKDQRSLAVGIVRLINTAEVIDCRTKDGKIDEGEKFLPWDELLNAPCFKEAQTRVIFTDFGISSLAPGPEIVPGLELRLVVSADGKHYNLWLGQKDVMCGFAFYSDERGVIYESKAIGCEVPKSTVPAVIEPVTRVRPVYPPAAKQAGIEGNVRLRVTINKDGSVMDIWVLSGPPTLVKAALEAVQQWRFSPNKVVRVTVVTVNFSLDKAGAAAPPAQVTAGRVNRSTPWGQLVSIAPVRILGRPSEILQNFA